MIQNGKHIESSLRRLSTQFGPKAVKFCIVRGTGQIFGSAVLYSLTEFLHVYYIYSNWAAAAVITQIAAFTGYKYRAFKLSTTRAAYSTKTQFVIHWMVWAGGLGIATGFLS